MEAVEEYLRKASSFVITEECQEEYFDNHNFLHVDCFKILLSKCLGYGIILGSMIVKFPQLYKIYQGKSAEGIRFTSQVLELTAISGTLAYGLSRYYPFSAYGETLFLGIQTSLIAFLCLYYGGKSAQAFGFLATYGVIMGFLCTEYAPKGLLELLATLNMPLVAGAKMLQVVENAKNKHTGQLSAITLILLFLGAVARVFTSLQETKDMLLVSSFVLASICNGLLVFQLIIYWNNSPTKTVDTKKTN